MTIINDGGPPEPELFYSRRTDGPMTIDEAVKVLHAELPGWWWKVGECHVSCDATIAPDRGGPDDELLTFEEFDQGFDCDLRQPATVAEALLGAIARAKPERDRAKRLLREIDRRS